MPSPIIPILLAGGAGTRLWPVSRDALPDHELAAYLATLAQKEKVAIEEGALALIARAAEGSARDALSLLDQAMAHGEGTDAISAEAIRAMLGLADRGRVLASTRGTRNQ